MVTTGSRIEQAFERRVFERWSIWIPGEMDETFVEAEGYWHAWDERRSISLTSFLIVDQDGRPVPARLILEAMPPTGGDTVPLPAEVSGWARSIETPDVSRADRAISGILAVDGNALLVTVTSNDLDWGRSVWASIRNHKAGGRSHRRAARRPH